MHLLFPSPFTLLLSLPSVASLPLFLSLSSLSSFSPYLHEDEDEEGAEGEVLVQAREEVRIRAVSDDLSDF